MLSGIEMPTRVWNILITATLMHLQALISSAIKRNRGKTSRQNTGTHRTPSSHFTLLPLRLVPTSEFITGSKWFCSQVSPSTLDTLPLLFQQSSWQSEFPAHKGPLAHLIQSAYLLFVMRPIGRGNKSLGDWKGIFGQQWNNTENICSFDSFYFLAPYNTARITLAATPYPIDLIILIEKSKQSLVLN